MMMKRRQQQEAAGLALGYQLGGVSFIHKDRENSLLGVISRCSLAALIQNENFKN